ncbi:hypothetical protein F5884DRAFT_8538 [Xylogone sp. PMI_703]|nr:hypothetical protein F5884DRAFT_8538 [Xylogone sp. PMI_703]
MLAPTRNHKDSMKSTWRHNRAQWNLSHQFFELLSLHHVDLDREVPVHAKTDKVPYVPEWRFERWVIIHALIPIAIHQALNSYLGYNLPAWVAFLLYLAAMTVNGTREVSLLRDLGHQYGHFDGDRHERDGVPDSGVFKTLQSIVLTFSLRPIMIVGITYRADKGPSTINWLWLLAEVGIYQVVLDFWFYRYHRVMHENASLWKLHRTHHLTKHPDPLLTIYSDGLQEVGDMLIIPLMTYGAMKLLGFPMGFYDWWVCFEYELFTEIFGHSSIRVSAATMNPLTPLFRLCNVDLTIEDDDLHHRKGSKTSYNYGKQTRIWDRLFGTCHPHIESYEENVDYVNTVQIPLL